MNKHIILIFLFLSNLAIAKADLIINEVMQSNIDCIMDDRNDFPDSWIELYNSGATREILSNYSIGETTDAASAWKLPARSVAAYGYALIYADTEAVGLHTDFRLDVEKDACLYLFKDNTLIDSLHISRKMISPNIAYGRERDGATKWGYELTPTPGAKNEGGLSGTILADPIFETPGCVMSSGTTYQIKISVPEGMPTGTEIRYTTNGTEPQANSAKYTTPITAKSTNVIRAKLFCSGCISSRSVTESYIVHPRSQTLPVISIATDPKYLNDSKVGIYTEGSYSSTKKNYEYNWRRPINFEYFEVNGQESELNQLCEARIAGAASRGCKYKSLALYAHKRFGTKHFKYEFFPDQREGLTKYKSIVLRNAGNDFDYLYLRDAMAQRSVASHADIDWQAWRPAIIYINGIYKGILNIRERGNDANIYTNYDGLEEVDVVENWTNVKEGDPEHIKEFRNFFNEHGHTLAEYDEVMDVNEFINYWAMNCYYGNIDFPGNNLMLWRPTAEGGRWRFIAKDIDYIMALYNQKQVLHNYPYFSWLNDNAYDTECQWGNTNDGTRLFRRLMEDADFKRLFTERMAIFMGDFLSSQRIQNEVLLPMYDVIKAEYPHHRALINQWWPNYNEELSRAKNWLDNRNEYLYRHLADYYKLGSLVSLQINTSLSQSDTEEIGVLMNGVELSNASFNGKFFAGNSLSLHSYARHTQGIVSWIVTKVSTTGSVTTERIEGPVCSFTLPACSKVIISANMGTVDGIDEIASDELDTNGVEIYDIQGRRQTGIRSGINILRSGRGTTYRIK